jgi:septum formation protein
MTLPKVTLASKSAARAAILAGAQIAFDTVVSSVDEDVVKTEMLGSGFSPRDIAEALAERKAVDVSRSRQGLVVGADQTLEFSGKLYDKAENLQVVRDRLKMLRGQSHQLHAGVVVAQDGVAIWRETITAVLTMRSFSDDFLESYLAAEGPEVLSSVGCYRLEGLGAQLFTVIKGDYFAILGLPLMGLLQLFRRQGIIAE